MSKLQPVRGTHDILPLEWRRHAAVIDPARTIAATFGFETIVTPIFEFTEVFARTLGDASDIVTKEMYSFEDRSGDSLTLRPEGTAGVARAVISNALTQDLPLKFFYHGPMFRHERPQKGRQRQFHQIGIELIGIATPLADIEVIACGAELLDRLGVLKDCVLHLNSLGDAESRAKYRAALIAYFSDYRDRLSEDSRTRLEKNPLRILDSKDEGDRALIDGAPSLHDHYSDAAKDFFAGVCDGLDALGIGYAVDPRLVRGLDYYGHTAFEFVTNALGAQGTVLAGGRYDGLIGQMGGPSVPGVGWAAGVERLAMLIAEPPPPPRPVVLCALGAAAERRALTLAQRLRRDGRQVDIPATGNLKKKLARAGKINAAEAWIIGDDELARGIVVIRDLDSGEQREVPLA